MSRATNQAIALLAILSGIMSEVEKRKLVARLDVRAKIAQTKEEAFDVINSWGETGSGRKNTEIICEALLKWDQTFFSGGRHLNQNAAALFSMADQIVVDLLGKVKNPFRRKLLEGLGKTTAWLREYEDPDGINFPAMDESNICLGALYSIVGFEP